MITCKHYQLDVRCCDWNIAHIFEHMLIMGAKSHLRSNGINIDLFGWISGLTFEEQLFLDGGFYQEKSARLFDDYMRGPHDFSKEDIQRAIISVELEEKSHFTVYDNTNVTETINKLNHLKWNTVFAGPAAPVSSVLKRASRDFRDIAIIVTATELSPSEQKVFIRLWPIVADIINNFLATKAGSYEVGTSPVRDRATALQFFSVYTIPATKGKLTDLQNELTAHLLEYDIQAAWPDFAAHFNAFASTELWKDSATEYFRNTGIVTTTSEIQSLATKNTVANVFKHLNIHMRTAKSCERQLVMI